MTPSITVRTTYVISDRDGVLPARVRARVFVCLCVCLLRGGRRRLCADPLAVKGDLRGLHTFHRQYKLHSEPIILETSALDMNRPIQCRRKQEWWKRTDIVPCRNNQRASRDRRTTPESTLATHLIEWGPVAGFESLCNLPYWCSPREEIGTRSSAS